MKKTLFDLQPGDNILVNKTIMGARIFNIWDAAEEKEVEIHRLPGLGKAKRNDVLVFHYPYPHSNDSCFDALVEVLRETLYRPAGRYHGHLEGTLLYRISAQLLGSP